VEKSALNHQAARNRAASRSTRPNKKLDECIVRRLDAVRRTGELRFVEHVGHDLKGTL
jgi:hypothetical protein